MIDMSILTWVLLGLVAGLLGSKILSRRGEDMFLDVGLAIAGALTGGYLFGFFRPDRQGGLDLSSVLVATVGAILVLVVYHGIRRIAVERR
jgi:uncharacterized membrane protein YeaQ/YmgE (transglycosylase-associated protein family)